MDKNKQLRLNELAKHFARTDIRRLLMKEFGDRQTTFSGVNENGEDVLLSIFSDHIAVSTYQHNGWIRINSYDSDGYAEGETYKGRWTE